MAPTPLTSEEEAQLLEKITDALANDRKEEAKA